MRKKYVLVETVAMFRHRYVVELEESEPNEYALDTFVSGEAKEFSQYYLDENVVSHRTMSKSDLLALCDEDNDYAADWHEDTKIEQFVTRSGS